MHQMAKTPTVKAPAERFTGDVWVDGITTATPPTRLTAALVRFAPCARTAWRRHALGEWHWHGTGPRPLHEPPRPVRVQQRSGHPGAPSRRR
jgi:quercetin dioxygenase-like cupin family protein